MHAHHTDAVHLPTPALNTLEAVQVITEDSDLLPYGCPRVLFKMDKDGHGQQVCLVDLPRNRNPGFAGFTHDMFLEVCDLHRETVVRSKHALWNV